MAVCCGEEGDWAEVDEEFEAWDRCKEFFAEVNSAEALATPELLRFFSPPLPFPLLSSPVLRVSRPSDCDAEPGLLERLSLAEGGASSASFVGLPDPEFPNILFRRPPSLENLRSF